MGPIEDGGDLVRVGGDASGGDDMADKVHLGYRKVALGGVGIEVIGGEGGEGGAEVVLVLLYVTREDQDVVQVDDDEGIEMGAKNIVHKALEGSGGVGEAERHDGVLEMPIPSPEGGLGNVLGVDADLVVAMTQVDLGKNRGTMEAVEEFINAGKGVAVLNGDVVKAAVVNAQTEGTIFFADKEDGGAVG